ncbi:hypothetical protein J2X72_001436 [Phyllobacterium sp. 1468]|uniref:TnsA endonuclease N-terminal domain-containing protein n=1 Tax=Phyllobacterium sp. 1468 TaxID=2817759 RepID=UPI002859D67E|nr:TnsA endonuclease N-terminal domain-containing protein [Phyllobacterium sp. 1468]MDR6632652.1 hypothetical protein [Phyllobacterium sp. 1468]
MNPKNNRLMRYESNLERDAAYILIAHPDVVHVQEQPPAIAYFDRFGVEHTHTFDFEVLMKDGSRRAIAVKPEARVKATGIEEKLRLIREQRPPGCADIIQLRTERHITRNRAANARLIIRANRSRSEENIVEVHRALRLFLAPVPIADVLAAATIPDSPGFMAVLCLIGDGHVQVLDSDRITYRSKVQLNQSTQPGKGQ